MPRGLRFSALRVFTFATGRSYVSVYSAIASHANEKRHVRARNDIPLSRDVRVLRAFFPTRLHCYFSRTEDHPTFSKNVTRGPGPRRRSKFLISPGRKKREDWDSSSAADSLSKKKITDNPPKKPEFPRAPDIGIRFFLVGPLPFSLFAFRHAPLWLRLVEFARKAIIIILAS